MMILCIGFDKSLSRGLCGSKRRRFALLAEGTTQQLVLCRRKGGIFLVFLTIKKLKSLSRGSRLEAHTKI